MTHSFWFWFIVWFVGGVIAYLLFKKATKRMFDKWTFGDMVNTIFMALFSWVCVLAIFFMCFEDITYDCNFWNKPAKW
jgi:hypothetical protein